MPQGISDVEEEEVKESSVEETFIEEGEETDVEESNFTEEQIAEFASVAGVKVELFTETYSTLDELFAVVKKETVRVTRMQESTQPPQPNGNKTKVKDPIADEAAFQESLTEINTRFGG